MYSKRIVVIELIKIDKTKVTRQQKFFFVLVLKQIILQQNHTTTKRILFTRFRYLVSRSDGLPASVPVTY